jgi:hypothetical protein
MGIGVLVLGKSGSGKTASLRNFKPGEALVCSVANKPLPFKTKLDVVKTPNYNAIYRAMKDKQYKVYVIDDSQYLMAFEMFTRAKEKGYDKFTDIAVNFERLLRVIRDSMPDDCIVYLLHHTEVDDIGDVKAKTIGRMLDNQLTIEGLFSIVLITETDGKEHKFITQSNGHTPAKSPMEMFPEEMDNDLKAVDTAIRGYYGIGNTGK